jgi:hypothetical protein
MYTEIVPQPAAIGVALPVFLVPLVCLVVALLVLRLATKASWLTSIGASMVIATVSSILGIRMSARDHAPDSPLEVAWIILLPATVGAAILIVQLFRWLLTTRTAQANVNAAERSRILKMVEEGKISTEEGSDLLEAMGRSSALQGQDAFSRLDLTMLMGVALVILGFFLPWDYLGRNMYQAGHHRGPIGWAVLMAAVLSAVPIFVTPKDLLYKISMLQIFLVLVGLVLVIKELAVGADQVGSILCAVGFFVALLSSGFKLRSLAA